MVAVGKILKAIDKLTKEEQRGFIVGLCMLYEAETDKLKNEINKLKDTVEQLNKDMQNY